MAFEPVGLSQDLSAQRVMRAQVAGQDIAVWRGASLSVQAWGNRCPHRGMRLSHGFVRGDSLACAYHGWHYNCQATCHYIPAHPELPPPATIKPEVFSVVEAQGVLWVSIDDAAAPPHLPDNCVGIRSISLDCSADKALTAFMENLPSKELQTDLKARLHTDNPNIIEFHDVAADVAVWVLLQASTPQVVNAHVLANGDRSINERIALSQWCETVRRSAESGGDDNNP